MQRHHQRPLHLAIFHRMCQERQKNGFDCRRQALTGLACLKQLSHASVDQRPEWLNQIVRQCKGVGSMTMGNAQ